MQTNVSSRSREGRTEVVFVVAAGSAVLDVVKYFLTM